METTRNSIKQRFGYTPTYGNSIAKTGFGLRIGIGFVLLLLTMLSGFVVSMQTIDDLTGAMELLARTDHVSNTSFKLTTAVESFNSRRDSLSVQEVESQLEKFEQSLQDLKKFTLARGSGVRQIQDALGAIEKYRESFLDMQTLEEKRSSLLYEMGEILEQLIVQVSIITSRNREEFFNTRRNVDVIDNSRVSVAAAAELTSQIVVSINNLQQIQTQKQKKINVLDIPRLNEKARGIIENTINSITELNGYLSDQSETIYRLEQYLSAFKESLVENLRNDGVILDRDAYNLLQAEANKLHGIAVERHEVLQISARQERGRLDTAIDELSLASNVSIQLSTLQANRRAMQASSAEAPGDALQLLDKVIVRIKGSGEGQELRNIGWQNVYNLLDDYLILVKRYKTEAESYQNSIEHMKEMHLALDINTGGVFQNEFERASEQQERAREIVMAAGAIAFLLSLLFASLITGRLSRELDRLSTVMHKIAKGDTEVEVPYLNRRDQAGNMAKALEVFRINAEELKRNHNFLELLIENIPNMLFVKDADGLRFMRLNKAGEQLLGYTQDELIGKTAHDLFNKDLADSIFENDQYVFKHGKMVEINDHRVHSRHRGERILHTKKIPILGDNGNPLYLLGISEDITERKEAEAQIRTLSQAVEQSPVSVVITDPDANIEYVNSTFEKISGYRSREVIGKNPRIIKSDKTPKTLYRELWQVITNGGTWQGELQNRKKNGEIFWEHVHISPVFDESGVIRHYLAVKEDITLQKKQEEKILHQAHFDSLTNLPNRFLVLDRLSQLVIEAKRNHDGVAVLFLDLDDFKKVNDTLGHSTGDKVLIEAADRLRSAVRSGDTVGRLGGDEFIVLLGGIDTPQDTMQIVENLLMKFREVFEIEGRELVLTTSIGVAVYPNDGESSSELLKSADSAMYHSKEQGRNTYSYFTDAMNQQVSRRLLLEEQMHGALGRNEFSLCYQPQIDVSSSNIIGIEALLRWRNPALGEISPDEFIPIAEQTGLIVPIGEFVLKEALTRASGWMKSYRDDFVIAVNLSPRQFRDPGLVDCIQGELKRTGVRNELLELEITEGVLMSGHGYIEETLKSLSDIGISIAMDDFGTGYSSLSYLRSYPFNMLKIDRTFVNDITVDDADLELVNAAIAMAHGLGLKVIAEGVETEEQLNLLASMKCDRVQGYLFGEPVPAEKISDILSQHDSVRNLCKGKKKHFKSQPV